MISSLIAPGTSGVPVYDIRARGAVGDGVTDNTAAIRRAITEADAVGGAVVYVPEGRYLCDPLTLPANTCLAGGAPETSILQRRASGTGPFITDAGDATGIQIHNLTADAAYFGSDVIKLGWGSQNWNLRASMTNVVATRSEQNTGIGINVMANVAHLRDVWAVGCATGMKLWGSAIYGYHINIELWNVKALNISGQTHVIYGLQVEDYTNPSSICTSAITTTELRDSQIVGLYYIHQNNSYTNLVLIDALSRRNRFDHVMVQKAAGTLTNIFNWTGVETVPFSGATGDTAWSLQPSYEQLEGPQIWRGHSSTPNALLETHGGYIAARGATTSAQVLQARVSGDTQPRYTLAEDGTQGWGGGSSINTVTLAYDGSTTMTMTGASLGMQRSTSGPSAIGVSVAGDSSFRWQATAGGVLYFSNGAGGGNDTNLYRAAADTLQTDDELVASGGIVTKVKAGTPSDADMATPASGAIIVDTSASKIWVRVGTTWKSVALS